MNSARLIRVTESKRKIAPETDRKLFLRDCSRSISLKLHSGDVYRKRRRSTHDTNVWTNWLTDCNENGETLSLAHHTHSIILIDSPAPRHQPLSIERNTHTRRPSQLAHTTNSANIVYFPISHEVSTRSTATRMQC